MPRGPPPEEWEAHKSLIETLYVYQGYKAIEVCQYLAREHGFIITERQLEYRLVSWKMKKKSSKKAYTAVARLLKKWGPKDKGGKMDTGEKMPFISDDDIFQLYSSTPSNGYCRDIGYLLRKDVTAQPPRYPDLSMPRYRIADELLYINTPEIPSFLLEVPADSGEDSTSGADPILALDDDVVNQAIQTNKITKTSFTYLLTQSSEALNVRIDINFLGQFLFRTVYLINNNLIVDDEIEAIYQLVSTYSQLENLFKKILSLTGEGAQHFRERVFNFAIRTPKLQLLGLFIESEDETVFAKFASSRTAEILARSHPNICEAIIPFLKGPVLLPEPKLLHQTHYPHFVRMYQALLDCGLVRLDSLRMYRDEFSENEFAICNGTLGTEIFLAALEENCADIADFLSDNCVSFDNPRTFWEVITQPNTHLLAVKLWISKNTTLNAQWLSSCTLDSEKMRFQMPGREYFGSHPCFIGCHPKCRDHRYSFDTGICPSCNLAPRSQSQANIRCGVEGCFCLRHPLPLPLFNNAFWQVLQVQDGAKIFDWILEKHFPLGNIEDIFMLSVGTTMVPGYSNYHIFRRLFQTYQPALQKALGCDRLLSEAIYYKQADILKMIIKQRTRSISLEAYRLIFEFRDHELLGLIPPPLFQDLDKGEINSSDTPRLVDTLWKPDDTALAEFFFQNFPPAIEDLSPDRRVKYLENRFNLGETRGFMDITSDSRVDILLLVIKNLFHHEYLKTLENLAVLLVKNFGGVGLQMVVGEVAEYLRVQRPKDTQDGVQFLNKRILLFIPILRSIKNCISDGISFRPIQILRVIRPIINILVQYALDSQMHQEFLVLLKNLVSLYSDVGSQRIFDVVPGLHSMVVADARFAMCHSLQPYQLLNNLEALVPLGWNINARDSAGCSLLTYSTMSESQLSYARVQDDTYDPGDDGTTFESSQTLNSLVLSKGLIDMGARVGMSPILEDGYLSHLTILFNSVRAGDYKITRLLLKYGAAKFLKYSTYSNHDMVTWFLNKKGLGLTGWSQIQLVNPLQCAARQGDEKMVLLLLQYGADVNASSKYGFTALDQAAVMGRADTVDMLLKVGTKKKRFQAAELAEGEGFHRVAKKIRGFPITEEGIDAESREVAMQLEEIEGGREWYQG
ncbi:hypothetical protein TWF281_002639 [Arthrobotrys megalospora]